MNRPQQFSGQGPSSPGVPRVHPARPAHDSKIQPILSTSTPPGHLSGAAEGLPIRLPTIDSRLLQNRANLMLQVLTMCPDWQYFPMTNTTLMMRGMIHWTWAVQEASPKQLEVSSNLPEAIWQKDGVAHV